MSSNQQHPGYDVHHSEPKSSDLAYTIPRVTCTSRVVKRTNHNATDYFCCDPAKYDPNAPGGCNCIPGANGRGYTKFNKNYWIGALENPNYRHGYTPTYKC